MRKTLLLLAILFTLPSLAQRQTLDSLKAALAQTRNDIDRAGLLNAVAAEYRQTDPKQMLQYAEKALALATKIKFVQAKGDAYLNKGNANVILGNYPEALRNFSDAQAIFESASDANDKNIKNGLARAYGSIGIVFSEQSNYPKALQYHLKAVGIYEAIGNLDRSARIYNNI